MIIDDNIRVLVRAAETGGPDTDAVLRRLVLALHTACERPDVKARTAVLHAAASPGLAAYPVDADGYAVAFDALTDEAAFIAAWQQYGMVVGKGILTPAACAAVRDGIKARFNALSRGACDLDRPETWANMPADDKGVPILSRGFFEIYHDDLLAQIRQNVRAYVHHVLIWGRADLWSSFDRLGVKLPAHEESKALSLHVDQNPNVHPHFKTVQGVLALCDCPVERGTFVGVPGSRDYFPAYAAMAQNRGEFVEMDVSAPIAPLMKQHAQPIPLRAGDMVSWDSRTTHANSENMSDQMRVVMYHAYGPAREDLPEAIEARREALRTGIGSNMREALMHASKKSRYSDYDALARVRAPEKLNLLGKLVYGTETYAKIIATPAP
jgi:hypothetical protein